VLYAAQAPILTDTRLIEVARDGNRLTAKLENEFSSTVEERVFDKVVVEYGTAPADALYHELKPGSKNRGSIDLNAFADNQPQPTVTDNSDGYLLYRIGDSVASRNIHAAIYEARRLCVQI
jgi:hypothetical protein